MFSRSPYYNSPSYYAPQDDYLYGYQNPYARAQAQAQAEQQRRAHLLALERQRDLERQRAAAAEAARRQRASQYLPEAGMMYPGRNRSYIPERASQYLPHEFDNYGSAVDDDGDAYDYGFGRGGPFWNTWPAGQATRPADTRTGQTQTAQVAHTRKQSRSRSRVRSKSPAASSPSEHIEIPISEPQHPNPSPLPTQSPFPPTPANQLPTPTPEMQEAATKIQTSYRIHRSLKSIDSLSRRFCDLKSAFTLPRSLDFQILIPEQHVSIPLENLNPSSARDALTSAGLNMFTLDRISTPKLAYTHANAPIHGYVESLNRLLTSLDGVESFGQKEVRERRKEVVRAVESEAARIENTWKELWNRWMFLLKHGDEAVQPSGTDSNAEVSANGPTTEATTQDGGQMKDGHEIDEGFVSAS
ncbi:hypothetical protein AAF712_011602 [Marasmius tenuissimus]|uniref:BAG domain-containing protein n=1 Tax=Marasmius tenuissimus TaxID=585030 RepID=A0ABR2ZIU2_9AGAR